jgi:hypothetical protein
MRALIILAMLAMPALAKMRPPDGNSLTANEIANVMRSRQPALKACFNRAIKKNPRLTGRFVYTFTIEASGKVSRAAATAGTAESAPVDTCIVAAIKKIVFPKSSGPTTINFPFNSSPG